jgi:hypothetical protein
VAEALEALPKLDHALASGELNWSAVRELTRAAVRETEHEWLEFARGKTVRRLEQVLGGKQLGDTPSSPPDPSAQRHVLRFEVAAETFALFRPLLEREDRIICASLQLSDGVHLSPATEVVCSAPKLPPNVSLPTSSSCTSGWPAQNAITLTSDADVVCSSSAETCPPVADEASIEVSAPLVPAASATPSSSGCALSPRHRQAGSTGTGLACLLCLLSVRVLRVRRRASPARG